MNDVARVEPSKQLGDPRRLHGTSFPQGPRHQLEHIGAAARTALAAITE